MQKSPLLATTAIIATQAILLALSAVSAAVTVQAIQPSADEKADSQANKGPIDQADNACQKAGYDGYVNGDCGYLVSLTDLL